MGELESGSAISPSPAPLFFSHFVFLMYPSCRSFFLKEPLLRRDKLVNFLSDLIL